MFAQERQNQIEQILKESGAVTTASLVQRFGVSVETIRRDLLNMEQQGSLIKVHGGAVAKKDMKPHATLQQRNRKYRAQKDELAACAAKFINEGDVIGIDAGSTAISLADVLKARFSSLTVVTYSLDVIEILRDCPDFKVILCGGLYMQSENAFYGLQTITALSGLHMSKAFICPGAISLQHGLMDYTDDLLLVQKQIMSSSDEIYILADSSKMETTAIFKLDDMRTDYRYITDLSLPDELKRLYQENNIKIYT